MPLTSRPQYPTLHISGSAYPFICGNFVEQFDNLLGHPKKQLLTKPFVEYIL